MRAPCPLDDATPPPRSTRLSYHTVDGHAIYSLPTSASIYARMTRDDSNFGHWQTLRGKRRMTHEWHVLRRIRGIGMADERHQHFLSDYLYGVGGYGVCVSECMARSLLNAIGAVGWVVGLGTSPDALACPAGGLLSVGSRGAETGESTALPRQASIFRLKRRDCKSRTLE